MEEAPKYANSPMTVGANAGSRVRVMPHLSTGCSRVQLVAARNSFSSSCQPELEPSISRAIMMNGDEDCDNSNVFAVPDFWKCSTWLETSTGNDGEDTVFALDVNSA